MDMASMADIRFASDRARLGMAYRNVGLIPGDGGAWLLPRIVGLSKAAELAFTGDTIDADEALACGLASKVVPHEALMDEARALAARIARNPAHALRLTKKLLREAQFSRLETLLEMSAAYQALAHHNPAHDEAVAALIAQLEARKG
jgi:enoyl-CoA hydratase/carnithine racemase